VARDLVKLLAALADRTRLRLLNLMNRREVCVCYFVEILGVTQPKVSRHLAYLRRAGLVNARRDGKWIHYSISRPADPEAATVLDSTMRAIENDRQMVRDRMMMERACCAVKLPASLQNAPRPQASDLTDSGHR
jgi:ArsR family transcriptional regulator, arsenate/arsenite/antimonite-responsive transcriptional repressor